MPDVRLSLASIFDICRPISKEEFHPLLEGDAIYSRVEGPAYQPRVQLVLEATDEFLGLRSLFSDTGAGIGQMHHAGRDKTFIAHFHKAAFVHDVMCVVASGYRVPFPNTYNEWSMHMLISEYVNRSSMMHTRLKRGLGRINEWENYFRAPDPGTANYNLTTPHIILGNFVDLSYFHFMMDVVPRLWIYDEWPELKELPILVGPMREKFRGVLAEAIGVPDSQLVSIPQFAAARFSFDHLILPSALGDRMMSRAKLDYIRSKTVKDYAPPTKKPWRRIHISRADRPYKMAGNDLEVAKLLESYGFETILGASLTISEQAKLFGEAAIIIGISGGGFTNLMFMTPGSVVIELAPREAGPPDYGFLLLLELASLRDLHYLLVPSETETFDLPRGAPDPSDLGRPTSLTFNIDRIKSAVETALSRLEQTP